MWESSSKYDKKIIAVKVNPNPYAHGALPKKNPLSKGMN